jgi:hypothetical protein
MRWMLLLLLLLGVVAAQDDEESEIEIESGAKPEDEPEERPRGERPKPAGPIPARKSGAKVEWVPFTASNKLFTLSVPSDWRIQQTVTQKGLVECEVQVPGGKVAAKLQVRIAEGVLPPPTGMIVWYVRSEKERGQQIELRSNPRLHARVQHKQEWAALTVTPRIRGNTLVVSMIFALDQELLIKDDFFRAVARVDSGLPDAVVIPKNYKVKKKGWARWAVHPSAASKAKDLQKLVAAVEKRFTKFHGPASKDMGIATIFLHLNHSQGISLFQNLSKATGSVVDDASGLRMFLRPASLTDPNGRAGIASGVATFLFTRRYGTPYPEWVRIGELDLGFALAFAKLKPPKLHNAFLPWQEGMQIPPLQDLAATSAGKQSELQRHQSFYYVFFFHYGPSKYRKAYKNFLAELQRSGDPDVAMRKHLEPLGFNKLEEACSDFRARKIEYVVPK